jgi:Zn-dependent M16 (insulinase) family peptidase
MLCICLVFPQVIHANTIQGNLTTGQVYHGFKLVEQKEVAELKSTAMTFEHSKSGAHLFYIKNDDSNKVFSINFATPPTDDTGVNHIIEHSILAGSEKYPVKSTISSMMDRSLKTFMNALTYSDSTLYPIASKNSKDFKNLMSVYMDAVFYPNLRKDEKILQQEGWRYELSSKDDNLAYNGIVYNEMKGGYAAPEAVLQEAQMKALFPDSPYQYVSGGKPEIIPTLTRENYLETYNRNYHPSNSYIYLYGDLNLDETLSFIDKEYLSKFDKKEVNSSIKKQPAFTERVTVTKEYAAPANSPVDKKAYLSLSYVFDTEVYNDNPLAVAVLNAILTGLPYSPVKKALIDAGIGEDVYGSVTMDLQPTLSITVKNADESKKAEFVKIIEDTINSVVKSGIDKQLMDGILTSSEISLRAVNSAADRGIQYNKSVMSGWQYFNNPLKFIQYESDIAELKKGLNSNYFEELIKKYIIQNKHSALVVLKPKAGMNEEKITSLNNELKAYKSKLSDKQIEELVKETAALKAWQQAPDSPEAIDTLPKLSLTDLDKNIQKVPTDEKLVDGVKVLNHPIFTNNLAYVNMYFDASTIPVEKVPYLYLLANVLTKVDTDKYTSADITNLLLKNTGSLSANVSVIPDSKDKAAFVTKFTVSTYTVADKLPAAFELIGDILTSSKYDDAKELEKIISETRSALASSVIMDNISFAIQRNMSYYMPAVRYQNNATVNLYNLLVDLEKNFDSKKDVVIKNLKETAEAIFNKNGLVVSLTANDEAYDSFEKSFSLLSKRLSNKELPKYLYSYEAAAKNEAFAIPSAVQTVVKGANYKDLGFSYSGSMNVLNNLVNSYLFQAVRIQGGAYGGQFLTDDSGAAVFFSYSDPNLSETLKAFDNTAAYLQYLSANKLIDNATLNNLIINTIGQMDYPLSPQAKGSTADAYYLSNLSYEEVQKIRDEILATKASDIEKYLEMVSSVIKNGTYTVVGSETKIGENKTLFTKVINPLNEAIAPSSKESSKAVEVVKPSEEKKPDEQTKPNEEAKPQKEESTQVSAEVAASTEKVNDVSAKPLPKTGSTLDLEVLILSGALIFAVGVALARNKKNAKEN